MLQRTATALTAWSTRWVPDAWIIAVLLTLVTVLLALLFTTSRPDQLVVYWGNGFWALLSFAMQMALIILSGYILSTTPLFGRALNALAGVPRSPAQAVALMALVSMLLGWINWGLSIVGSAVFVRYMASRQRGVDYRLLVATAYLGLGVMWHSGLSASAPLLVATPRHFMEDRMGLVPITETIFNPFNLVLALVVLVAMTALAPAMHPRKQDVVEADRRLLLHPVAGGADGEPAAAQAPRRLTPAQWLSQAPIVNLAVGLAGLFWVAAAVVSRGFAAVDLNFVIFVFLMLGILLHWTPQSFLRSAEDGSVYIWGVVIQFPFYAGIFGIIQSSGLDKVIANWFVAIANAQTFPIIIYWYSAVLNYIVPSGGSKWAIEAPYVIEAANQIGISPALAVVSYAWGDMATDIIQPFWAIPLLGVAKLEFRHIMGYCLIFFAIYAVLVSIAFTLVPFLGLF
jgi:short-chain fatty acids transporter